MAANSQIRHNPHEHQDQAIEDNNAKDDNNNDDHSNNNNHFYYCHNHCSNNNKIYDPAAVAATRLQSG